LWKQEEYDEYEGDPHNTSDNQKNIIIPENQCNESALTYVDNIKNAHAKNLAK